MDTLSLLIISVGLGMDAFAVSITCGVSIEALKKRHVVRVALAFGLFQAVMPVAGWLLGLGFRGLIESIDHWVAFLLLAFVGGKMLWEARQTYEKKSNPLDWHVLFIMSVATSIDALAVGLTFAVLKISIITPVLVIGLVTFLMSGAGVFLGDRTGNLVGKRVDVAGGLILIGIGLKILIEHLVQGC
ncbi:MAG: manganese efflux pump MntP family protein [candidate division KSB1 bacterium]|nr:manganese efflux pump MntP family protein [candidate division KSB1 bacterium]